MVLERVAGERGAGVTYLGQLVRIHPVAGSHPRTAPAAALGVPPGVSESPPAAPRGISSGGLVILPTRAAPIPTPPSAPLPPSAADTGRQAPTPTPTPTPTPAPAPAPAPASATAPSAAPNAARERPSETAQAQADRVRPTRVLPPIAPPEEPRAAVPAIPPAPPATRAAGGSGSATIRNAYPAQRQPVRDGAWRAVRGESLDQVLGDWAERAGWTLVFNSPVIYEIQAGAEFQGEFTEAVAALVRSVRARPVPIATFYRGNSVLVISNNTNGN